jgi:hypothetical protein
MEHSRINNIKPLPTRGMLDQETIDEWAETDGFELAFCKTCHVMTNHKDNVCQKCKRIID